MRQIGTFKTSPSPAQFILQKCWLPLVLSRLTLNGHFTTSSPNQHLHPHSQLMTLPPTSQRNRSHQAELPQLIPSTPSHIPASAPALSSFPSCFFCRLCSRSCALVFSATSFPPCSSFSHLQNDRYLPQVQLHFLPLPVSFLLTSQISRETWLS